jgi:hypothetical protein
VVVGDVGEALTVAGNGESTNFDDDTKEPILFFMRCYLQMIDLFLIAIRTVYLSLGF